MCKDLGISQNQAPSQYSISIYKICSQLAFQLLADTSIAFFLYFSMVPSRPLLFQSDPWICLEESSHAPSMICSFFYLPQPPKSYLFQFIVPWLGWWYFITPMVTSEITSDIFSQHFQQQLLSEECFLVAIFLLSLRYSENRGLFKIAFWEPAWSLSAGPCEIPGAAEWGDNFF